MILAGRRFHLIGIGGAGMSGLALVAHELGADVSGSDRAPSSYTERLVAAGVPVSIGHDAAHLPARGEVVVSTAIADDNPELAAARERGLRVLHRSELLAELAAAKRCIAVAGAHGKTTTTAMIVHALDALGLEPAYFVGGEVRVGGATTNAGWGRGELIVVEADESDRSFLRLDPEIAVVTNVELDHHTTYSGGYPELLGAFAEFASGARTTVRWGGQPDLDAVVAGEEVSFGIAPPSSREAAVAFDLTAADVQTPADAALGTEFDLIAAGRRTHVRLGVRGDHNVLNALAALGAVGAAAGIPVDEAAATLETFGGVGRRFELVGECRGARIYDDYAHHPTEVRAALTAARQSVEGGRLIAVFQPHLYSRTASLAREFGAALSLADIVVVTGIYPAREDPADFPGVSGYAVAAAACDAARGCPVYWLPEIAEAGAVVDRILRAGDLCITIGAGDVFRLAHSLACAEAGD